MIKIRWFNILLAVALILFLPLDTIRTIRRTLASFVMFQWRRMSVLSAIIYAALVKNGHDPNDLIEDLERYLDERE